MRYAHVQQSGFVAAQVLQLSDDGYIMARSFVQAGGSLGSYLQESGDEFYQGRTYQSEQAARDSQLEEPFAQYMEWAECQNAQESSDRESRARDILQGDKNLPNLLSIQSRIAALIEERDRLLKEAGYEKMGYDDISWWGRKDLAFVLPEDQMPAGGSFPTYY